MREVNFSIPNGNRASVSITHALYDRRALDCTSTLPLINSLNHLCYLTTSSARIREILTIDGGVERLICILKNGRTQDMMETWKWNLAFHCVVNIGVRGSDGRGSDSRGSENIRTRVVEADIVPVIATILDSFLKVVAKTRSQHTDHDVKRSRARLGSFRRRHDEDNERASRSSRREAPPPIAIPPGPQVSSPMLNQAQLPEQATSLRPFHPHRHHRRHVSLPGHTQAAVEEDRLPMSGRNFTRTDHLTASDPNLLPPMTATSQPETPLTPRPPIDHPEASEPRGEADSILRRLSQRQPSIRREVSTSGDSDEGQLGTTRHEDIDADLNPDIDPLGGVRTLLDPTPGQSTAEDTAATDVASAVPIPLNHPTMDGTIIDSAATPRPAVRMPPPLVVNSPPAPEASGRTPNLTRENWRNIHGYPTSSTPRDEDVIMSLQLLAYISKYCDLRSYFQQTHLVPRLKMSKKELNQIDMTNKGPCEKPFEDTHQDDEEIVDNDSEYEQPDDYNIFPLVEQFTVKWHSQEMKYWAGVVMRNLCRKDKSRGDIRQCAYYKCGKWEDYAKQFAKCRRCRQTKYCSKECQKK